MPYKTFSIEKTFLRHSREKRRKFSGVQNLFSFSTHLCNINNKTRKYQPIKKKHYEKISTISRMPVRYTGRRLGR